MILPQQDCGLCLNILENRGILNKSTRIFHGLYSDQPQKWRQPIQNFAMLHLPLEHFDVTCISMVDKSTDHGKLLSICFWCLHCISIEVSCKIGCRRRKTNCATVMSFPWSVHSFLSSIALNQTAREKLLSYGKKVLWPGLWTGTMAK